MSIRSLSDLAVKRDMTSVGKTVGSDNPDREFERVSDTVVSTIPAEVVVLYTAVTGGTLATEIVTNAHSYMPYRWALLAAALILTPLSVFITYRAKFRSAKRSGKSLHGHLLPDRPSWPWLEIVTATVATAAWVTVLPGSPLLVDMSRAAAEMTSVAVTVGAAAVLWLSGIKLSKGNTQSPNIPSVVPTTAPATSTTPPTSIK